MDINEIIKNILGLLTGVGLFMVACDILSDNLQAVSSDKLKTLFSKVSNNKIIGVCIGAVTAMAVQSSGATIVMLIGFVNTNIISLGQAAAIVLGSEIGTTLTGQIVALGVMSENTISIGVIFATFVGIGAIIELVAKKDQTKKICGIMIGFGMNFVALSTMSGAMESFAQLDELKTFISTISSPTLLIIIGTVVTALMQSSSAMASITITMIAASLINLEQGIYITLGSNIGSCVTGLLAAVTSGANAKRTSLFQFLFNSIGVVIFAIIDTIVKVATGGNVSSTVLIATAFPNVPSSQLAMFNTLFNILTVVVALPVSNNLMNLCKSLIKKNEEIEDELKLYYFDENMMSTPSIAVHQIRNEIINMSKFAMNNFNKSLDIITTLDFSKEKEFAHSEDELDYLNQTLVPIITRLSKKVSNEKDHTFLSSSYRVISDLERIGDYSVNIVEYAQFLSSTKQKFSKKAVNEINEVRTVINELYDLTLEVYNEYDNNLMLKAQELEEKVDDLTELMSKNHIKRMNDGECNADIGAQYLQLSSDVERIADHLININDNDYINV